MSLILNNWYATKPPMGVKINYSHPLASGLVGFWLFNEGNGTKAIDSTENRNDGTLTSFTPFSSSQGWSPGLNGPSLIFNGTAVTGPYVNCGNSKSLDLTSSFTISAWINATGSGNVILAKRPNANDCNYDILITAGNNILLFWDNPSGTSRSLTSTNTINLKTWTNVIITYDIGTNKVNFYINSIPDAGNPQTPAAGFLANTGNMIIGTQNEAALNSFFNGKISLVTIWKNRALNLKEIQQLYTQPLGMFAKNEIRRMPTIITLPPQLIKAKTRLIPI